MNGAGVAYNSNLIVLASINTVTARDRVTKELQTILLDVYQAYWDLYLQRTLLLQKRRLYQDGLEICEMLNARSEVDVLAGELGRAKAAVASRYAAVLRQEAVLLNADAKLRTLINDPCLSETRRQELIPVEKPIRTPCPVTFQDSLGRRPSPSSRD